MKVKSRPIFLFVGNESPGRFCAFHGAVRRISDCLCGLQKGILFDGMKIIRYNKHQSAGMALPNAFFGFPPPVFNRNGIHSGM